MPAIARVLVLVLLLAAVPAAQAPPPTVREEAQALLRRGVPVALVLGPDLQAALDARAPVSRRGDRDGDGDRRALLTALAARWAGRLDVFDDGTVVTLRDPTPSCLPQLGRTFDATGIVGPPSAVVFTFAVKLDPRLEGQPPPGVLGSGIGPIDDPAEEARRAADGRMLAVTPLALAGGTMSLQAALNELVTKAGRLGWAIGSEPHVDGREVCRIALLTRSTTLTTFHEIPPP